MRYLLILSLLLTGCNVSVGNSDEKLIMLHNKAQAMAPKRVCYQVTAPNEIKGQYCLQYMGEK